jgi:T5SS/PEP-CTERM-associated repeat protein
MPLVAPWFRLGGRREVMSRCKGMHRKPGLILSRSRGAFAIAAATMFLTRRSFAQTYWQGSTGDWFNAANWTGGVPGSASTADINNGGTAQIISGSAAAIIEYVGDSAVGTLSQSGGSNTIGSGLCVGNQYGSTGTYILSGTGSLSVDDGEYIGGPDGGLGIFDQSGGTNTISANSLFVGYQDGNGRAGGGTYTLSGGTLAASAQYAGEYVGYMSAGTFIQSGGLNTIDDAHLILGFGRVGSYVLRGAGSLAVTGDEIVGYFGLATFNQSGGTNTIDQALGFGGALVLGDSGTGTYTLSGTGSLSVGGNEYIGDDGAGIFNQSGGTNITNSSLYVGDFTGTYSLSGSGLLSAGTEYVGSDGTGIFNQSGGTNATSGLYVGDGRPSTGTYTLSGTGSLIVTGNEYVGDKANGTLNQTDGTNTINGGNSLYVGYGNFGFSTPTYNLGGTGLLAATGNEYVGYSAAGNFIQSGGGNQTSGLYLGYAATYVGTGVYTLSGTGSLTSTGNEYVGFSGIGTFRQSGGVNLTSELDFGYVSGSVGTYSLSGGTTTVSGSIYVGGSSAGPGGTGTLTVSDSGQLSVAGTMKVYDNGLVNINGGSTTIGGLSICSSGVVNVNSSLFINYGSLASDPISTIVGYLAGGYNNGAWNGAGINSTGAAASAGQSPLYSVGYADGNLDVGTPAGPNQILVMYTLAGDALLDGTVNMTDLLIVAQNYGKTGEDWAGGNFTYDPNGYVGFEDLLMVCQNFNQSLAGSADDALGGSTLPLDARATIASVPEPASIGALAIFGCGLLVRRRRTDLNR